MIKAKTSLPTDKKVSKLIAFTGGGSSGHVNPSIPIVEEFLLQGWSVIYIGSRNGPEREICTRVEGIRYFPISTERYRRYRACSNLLIPWRVLMGILQSCWVLLRNRPTTLFSKGGFVTVPVVIAAFALRIPVISHESDLSPGLATRLNTRLSKKLLLTFPLSFYNHRWGKHLQVVSCGIPVRQSFKTASITQAESILGSKLIKPMLLVFGGSSGAKAINDAVRKELPDLLESFVVVHLTGKGNFCDQLSQNKDYHQFEYLHDGIESLMLASSAVICRAGMTSIIELVYLEKPAILVPLTAKVSRGDQLENAARMQELNMCIYLPEERLISEGLRGTMPEYLDRFDSMRNSMKELGVNFSPKLIMRSILEQ